jgi:hypothetical protein
MSSYARFLLLVFAASFISPSASAGSFAPDPPVSAAHAAPGLRGVVADPTGAIIPGAEIDVMDAKGTAVGQVH